MPAPELATNNAATLPRRLAVSPDSVNLCQAVSHVLATAKKAKALDVQVRMLAKCQRELLLQLEAQQEAAARAEQAAWQWQVCGPVPGVVCWLVPVVDVCTHAA